MTKSEDGLTRNSAACAMSSGRPRRPQGVLATVTSLIAWSAKVSRLSPVSMTPGLIELMRMRFGASSEAN